jgi:F-type H+-transporting ATPase subunit b
MRIDWWTLGLQTINVLVLVWLLGHFLFRPVAAMVAERQSEAAKLLDEARAMQSAAEAAKDKAAAQATMTEAARGEALKAAAAEAETEKAALVASARTEADRLRDAAAAEIEREKLAEAGVVARRASQLAVDIAGKVLARLPDEARITGFIDGLAEGVQALPEASRGSVGEDGVPLRLKAARGMTDAELNACRDTLGRALGRPIELAVDVDPSLIAGLEIETPHAIVRNSFRADLDRIAEELTRHDNAGQ